MPPVHLPKNFPDSSLQDDLCLRKERKELRTIYTVSSCACLRGSFKCLHAPQDSAKSMLCRPATKKLSSEKYMQVKQKLQSNFASGNP
eukprot:77892-Pelagomonas_calceolata.AAC.2